MIHKKALLVRSNDYSSLENRYKQLHSTELLDPFSYPTNTEGVAKLSATIVIPARNVESSILPCLTSIEQSSFNAKYQKMLQVVVIDDGSNDGTWDIVKSNRFALNLIVIRQKQSGQAQALNTGIAIAENDIIISCDADMILSYYAIEQLMLRHEQFDNVLLAGFRSDISKEDPLVNPQHIRQYGPHKCTSLLGDERVSFPTLGFPSNMCLASNNFKDLGNYKGLWMRNNTDSWLLSDLVFGALFSLPKETYYQIGGYDERLVGYGCTDGYLASKAISVGKYILPVYSASGLHISHFSRTENKLLEYKNNRQRFYKYIESTQIDDYPNYLKTAKSRIIEQITSNPSVIPFCNQNDDKSDLIPEFSKIDTLLAIGEYKKIISHIAMQRGPENATLQLKLGRAYSGLREYTKAVSIFKSLKGSFQEALLELSLAQAAEGQFVDAKESLSEYIEGSGQREDLSYWKQSPDVYVQQGILFFEQDHFETALKCFEISLIKDSSNKIARKYSNKCRDNLN